MLPKLAVLASALAATAVAQTQNIVQIAESAPELSTLVAALSAGGLVQTLEGNGPFTVFAPVNPAFAALGKNIPAWLLNPHNKAALDNVLTYHVVSGSITSGQIRNGQVIPTLDDKLTVTATVSGSGVKINNANVIKANIMASNGVVHEIDSVLVPSNIGYPSKDVIATALSVPALSTLVTAIKTANLTAALAAPEGPFTVFAPTNDAFAKLPKGELDYLLQHPRELAAVIEYHALPFRLYSEQIHNLQAAPTLLSGKDIVLFVTNGSVIVNGVASVVQANVDTSNAVVHLIDSVLIPKYVAERMAKALARTGKKASTRGGAAAVSEAALPNLVQLAESDPQLSILVKAVVAAGLADTLAGPGPFTVFAPLDSAFAALPTGVLEYLLSHIDDLKTVLLYHTVSGAVPSSALSNDEKVPTLEGGNITVTIIDQARIYVNQARVVTANLQASNGYAHLVDAVLLPPALSGF